MAKGTAICLILLTVTLGCDRTVKIPQDLQGQVGSGKKLVDETSGDNRLLIYSYSLPPALTDFRCIRGWGLLGWVVNRRSGETASFGSCGEAGWGIIIDYSDLASGSVRCTDLTWDPRKASDDPDECVPFRMDTYIVGKKGPIEIRTEVVLEPEEGDDPKIAALKEEALNACRELSKKDGEQHYDQCEGRFMEALGHLRNMSVTKPETVIAALEEVKRELPAGHFQCIMSDFESEILEIGDIRGR